MSDVSVHPRLVPLLACFAPIGDRLWLWLEHWAAERPGAVALNDGNVSWTYAEYDRAVRR